MIRPVTLLLFILVASCRAQERFPDGEFKGFTRSPIEHIIVRVDEPITVRAVRGGVVFAGSELPLEGVLFEIRGPGNAERIRAASTGPNSHFHIRRVPDGTYTFKATKEGFQSVVGILIVSKNAHPKKNIELEMPVGV